MITVMGRTHYVLGFMLLKMADWQPFWISVLLLIDHMQYAGAT